MFGVIIMQEINKIFITDDYVVCQKPSGVTSEDGKTHGMPSLLSEGKPLLTVHRLDREVGGVTVYANNRKAAAKLSAQMTDGTFLKEYYAVVEGEVAQAGRWEDLLFKDSARNKSFVVDRERKGVKKAILNFERVAVTEFDGKRLSLVKIKLETGRTHQIRVQFSHKKHPVFGDRKYGASTSDGFGLFLKKIGFVCTETAEYKEFDLPFPDCLPWNLF